MAAVELKVFDLTKKEVGKVQGDDSIFKAKFKPSLLHDYVTMQRRAHRQGTASTKTRAEVAGSGKKPFKQKGTGNARQGGLSGPHQYGGGIAFGPKPRDYTTRMNSKAKAEAIRVALSQKNYEGKLGILNSFEIPGGKTKEAFKALSLFSTKASVLLIGDLSETAMRSIRNLVKIKAISPKGINVYDVLRFDQVLIVQDALAAIETKYKKAA